ncbi:unnamed protein product [marine sediment metagenome]|uniref:Uncharacterized protein n=1 Tax=marine sediment metagenome TaxID=412755 RepID=X0X8D0_9ZZZZ
MPVLLGPINSGLAWGYYLLGEPETAREHAERAIKIQSDTGTPFLLPLAYVILGAVALDSGELKNARSFIEEALSLAQNNNEKMLEGQSWVLLGSILGKADLSQGGKAEEYILQGIKIFDELELKAWSPTAYLFLGELYTDMGQREKALETLKKAEAAFKQMGIDYWPARTQEVLDRLES